ncbi:MAG TPA: pseudouridine synthase [Anaeromyxobacteraceae bacterium]|nr:pseudouridine synthase [Anaeromyxobacteraceae bacterium]
MSDERLQKFLASAGVASRRKAEELITSGRVKVNGVPVTELGTKVDAARDLVVVDGKPVERRDRQRYVLLYKPPGCVTTLSDPQGRRTAVDYLSGVGERVFPVGRLDYDAEGAVLFTTDGELANRLAHPRYGHRRIYLVKVKGDAPGEEGKLEAALLRMRAGLRLEDGPAQALEADVHEHTDKNVWLRVVVGEGRYHLVKRLCESVGLLVLRLFRPEFGGVSVEGLRPGRWRDLSADEVRAMKELVGLTGGGAGEVSGEAPTRRALPKPGRRHGHGAPLPGGGSAPRRAPDDEGEEPRRARAPADGRAKQGDAGAQPGRGPAQRGDSRRQRGGESRRDDRTHDRGAEARRDTRSRPSGERRATDDASSRGKTFGSAKRREGFGDSAQSRSTKAPVPRSKLRGGAPRAEARGAKGKPGAHGGGSGRRGSPRGSRR